MKKTNLTAEERFAVELGKKHVRYEKEKSFRPEPMALIAESAKLFDVYLRATADGGTRRVRAAILRHLTQKDGCTQAEIAEEEHFSAPAVSKELRALVAEGYVIRRTCDGDARASALSLSDSGRALEKELREHYREANRALFSLIPDIDKDRFTDTLVSLRNAILGEILNTEEKEK